jgi:hypothetical protein
MNNLKFWYYSHSMVLMVLRFLFNQNLPGRTGFFWKYPHYTRAVFAVK